MLYEDPRAYDLLFAERSDDLRFYLGLAEGARSVLEYGVGTGRIAIPLARACSGREVFGVDDSAAMIEALAAKVAAEPEELRSRIGWTLGDARTFALGRRFEQVWFPFNGMAHLYTRDDLAAFFSRVREHLEPGGVFAFDLWVPEAKLLAGAVLESGRFRDPTTGAMSSMREEFAFDPMTQVLSTRVEITALERPEEKRVLTLKQRMFWPEETLGLLELHGFEVLWRTARFMAPRDLSACAIDAQRPETQGAMLAYVCRPLDTGPR